MATVNEQCGQFVAVKVGVEERLPQRFRVCDSCKRCARSTDSSESHGIYQMLDDGCEDERQHLRWQIRQEEHAT